MPRHAFTALLLSVLLLLLLPLAVSAQDRGFPQLTGRVVDEAEVLSPETEARLVELLASHEAAGGVQVVVVTLSGLRGIDIADYSQRLAGAWGFDAADGAAGALLILAPRERAVRIEVGPALRDRLSPETARTIIEREILPPAQGGNYDLAMLQGTQAILANFAGGYVPSPPSAERRSDSLLARAIVVAIALFYLAALAYTLLSVRRRRQRRARQPAGRTSAAIAAVWHRQGRGRPNAGSESGTDGGSAGEAPGGAAGSGGGAGASGGW